MIARKWRYRKCWVTTGTFPDTRRQYVDAKCELCGSRADLQTHHKTPRAEGGSSCSYNLQTLCASCHSKQPGRGHSLIKADITRKIQYAAYGSIWNEARARQSYQCRECKSYVGAGEWYYWHKSYGERQRQILCYDCFGARERDAFGRIEASANRKEQSTRESEPDSGCFVASAVCAERDAICLRILRRFRDVYLRKNAVGRCAIQVYGVLGPVCASVVRRSAWAQRTLRPRIVWLAWRCRGRAREWEHR